ncbi:polyphosphate kinase 1 [Saccharicrinis fermentans]|uniref:Polyphosphate kinase n=1 Tax=Saccharicrinis fermentans DSM 9555 = JCM 21142 TaxID=869213 RepID=W7Y7R0_9BACT|nr:polyphosphate kinase 1 [Saccharicrinis fermentans]GAF04272.1 polyphosphate kinase [Saccharicrinis fermentans DSM 9555 = JCM 21142]
MKYIDRDLSWLSFNARVLQEVESETVPLLERLKFVAIYSSNLEEFYKVRVAGHRFEQKYNGDKKNKFGFRPSYILQQINAIVSEQQEKLGQLFYHELVPAMAREGIHFLYENIDKENLKLVSDYFDQHLKNNFVLRKIDDDASIDLVHQTVYLYFISLKGKYLLELDYDKWGRFITLYHDEKETRIIQLDDIFRYNVEKYLSKETEVYAVKISRDAELYIDEEQEDSIVRKIKRSLKKRETGLPSRLLFNEDIPFKHINYLRKKIDVDMTGLLPGGKYHNYYDFFKFPFFSHKPHLYNKKFSTVACSKLDNAADYFEQLKISDVFLSYPYQDFSYVANVLHKAALDAQVQEINITLYRVNKTSEICKALEKAAHKGKKVFVLVEVLARFDEESNIYWGERLEKAGASVKYGVKELKVHAKIFTIKRKEDKEIITYAYLGTGNLNEKTAKIYADHGILTVDKRYTHDLDEVFSFLKDETYRPEFKYLLVAPFVLRKGIYDLIDQEIEWAKSGKKAEMNIKLNSFEDPKMIHKIRQAADEGVTINMVVRGICCYFPLTKQQQNNIKIVSIVDQFLEHTRIYHFHHNGSPITYLASADWMTRNLSNRIEVAFPVFDKENQQLLVEEIYCQLSDSLKGRYLTQDAKNAYVDGKNKRTSQQLMFDLVKKYVRY